MPRIPPMGSTGPISMSQINAQFRRAAGAYISLNNAESSFYGPLNPTSPTGPNGSNPNSLSEWQGYTCVRLANLGFSSVYASYAVAALGSPTPIYATYWPPQTSYSIAGLVCEFYQDAVCTMNVSTGYYTDGIRWWYVEPVGYYTTVTREGAASAGNYPEGDPGNPALYTIITWDSYSSTTSDICDYTQKPHEHSNGTWLTYKATSNNLHYSSPSLSGYCQDGYYRKQTGTQTWGWIYIASGVEQGTTYTNCP